MNFDILGLILIALIVAVMFLQAWKSHLAARAKKKTFGDNETYEELAHYEAGLEHRASEIGQALKEATEEQRLILEAEQETLREKRQDLSAGCMIRQRLLKETAEILQEFKGNVPEAEWQHAQSELAVGTTNAAEYLLDQVAQNSHSLQAKAAFWGGKLAKGRIDYKQAITRFEQATTLEPENIHFLNEAGKMAYRLRRYSQAEVWLKQCLALEEEQHSKSEPYEQAVLLRNLAGVLAAQKKYAEAESCYQRALEIWKQKFGENHPQFAAELRRFAAFYEAHEKFTEAEPLYQQVIEMHGSQLGKSHPQVAQAMNDLACLYVSMERYREAEPLYQQAMNILKKTLSGSHPKVRQIDRNYEAMKKRRAEKR